MLLNVDTVVNDSKKISELPKLTKVTIHQENTWIPFAQYNERTNTYTNAAINLQAITSYNIDHSYSYIASEFNHHWIDLLEVGKSENYAQLTDNVNNSIIADKIVAYTFTYTIRHLDWQIVDGSYIPDYYARVHPDLIGIEDPKPMEVPDYENLFKDKKEEELPEENTE